MIFKELKIINIINTELYSNNKWAIVAEKEQT